MWFPPTSRSCWYVLGTRKDMAEQPYILLGFKEGITREKFEAAYGYHTTVSTPGYQTYFLWLMAGDYQGFNRSNDPEHDSKFILVLYSSKVSTELWRRGVAKVACTTASFSRSSSSLM